MRSQETEISVPSWSAEGVEFDAGESVVALEGVVWVTTTLDARDVILGPGEAMTFAKSGRAVVGGLAGKTVKVRVERPTAH